MTGAGPPTVTLGRVMLGVEGPALSAGDYQRLRHPQVGAVILFARNYESPEQLRALTLSIKQVRDPPLLIAVDQEGGRVQRFREGFTAIPPMRALGERYDGDRQAALAEAERWGRLIADEIGAFGVDFSFTPVLDLDAGACAAIGDRAFHSAPHAVTDIAAALCRGLHAGRMATVGKHFPGHGCVAADSHVALPVDPRPFEEIEAADLVPFAKLARSRAIDAVMPAHIVYPAVDDQPAGYSSRWLQDVLRGQIGFDGVIFSDDLEMAGAQGAGDIVARADLAVNAGCDMVLVCNDFAAMDTLLQQWTPGPPPSQRLESMRRAV
jgi:beta-N-acetylhexosaminidase